MIHMHVMQSCIPHLPHYVLQLHAQSGSYELGNSKLQLYSAVSTVWLLAHLGFLLVFSGHPGSPIIWALCSFIGSSTRRVCPVLPMCMGNTCMSFNPKSHTSSPMTQPSSHITQAVLQSGSSRPGNSWPPMFSMYIMQFYNQAVPDQSGNSWPPMFSM